MSLHATLLQSSNLFEGSLTRGGSIPSRLQIFLNVLINSSKELTLLEQRTLAQLLLVVLVVIDLLELQITGLSYACAWVHIVNPFSLSCT